MLYAAYPTTPYMYGRGFRKSRVASVGLRMVGAVAMRMIEECAGNAAKMQQEGPESN